MRSMKWSWSKILLVLSLTLIREPLAASMRPLDQVRGTADRIIAILTDPKLSGDAKRTERHQRLREELDQRFNWPNICRSCLGRHWTKLSKDQQNQFMEMFKQFLEHTYLDRIEPYYNELDHIEYQGERIAEENYASVKTVVSTKRKIDHPV